MIAARIALARLSAKLNTEDTEKREGLTIRIDREWLHKQSGGKHGEMHVVIGAWKHRPKLWNIGVRRQAGCKNRSADPTRDF
jgi:hypothetical protein